MSAEPSILVVGGELPTRLVVCVHCTRLTTVHCDFPLILRRWTDLPLPDGWIWTQGDLPLGRGSAPAMVPVCPVCAQLFDTDRQEFHRERERARDLPSAKE